MCNNNLVDFHMLHIPRRETGVPLKAIIRCVKDCSAVEEWSTKPAEIEFKCSESRE